MRQFDHREMVLTEKSQPPRPLRVPSWDKPTTVEAASMFHFMKSTSWPEWRWPGEHMCSPVRGLLGENPLPCMKTLSFGGNGKIISCFVFAFCFLQIFQHFRRQPHFPMQRTIHGRQSYAVSPVSSRGTYKSRTHSPDHLPPHAPLNL